MRTWFAQFVVVVLTVSVLAGCKSQSSTRSSPGWSLSSLNPFSARQDLAPAPPHPEKPSSLATPSSGAPPAASYASIDATKAQAKEGNDYANTAASYSDRQGLVDSSAADASHLSRAEYPVYAAAAGTAEPIAANSGLAATSASPQNEYPTAGAEFAYPSSSGTTPYPSAGNLNNTSSGGYQYPDTRGSAQSEPIAGTPYRVAADTHGVNGHAESPPQGDRLASVAPAESYASEASVPSSRDSATASGYGDSSAGSYGNYTFPRAPADYAQAAASDCSGPQCTGSGCRVAAGSAFPSGSSAVPPLTADARSSVSAGADRASGYNAYVNGEMASSEPSSNWVPGSTGYSPGGATPNMPGRTDYDPGNTGFNPPGISAYQMPTSSGSHWSPEADLQQAPPTGAEQAPGYSTPVRSADRMNAASPYLPGSTKRLSPRNYSRPSAPANTAPARLGDQPRIDRQVIPASTSL